MRREDRPGAHNRFQSLRNCLSSAVPSNSLNNISARATNRNANAGIKCSCNSKGYSFGNAQNQSSATCNSGGRCQKFLLNKQAANNSRDEMLPSTSKPLWRSRTAVDSSKVCPLHPHTAANKRITELQLKFPLWSPAYKRNGHNVSISIAFRFNILTLSSTSAIPTAPKPISSITKPKFDNHLFCGLRIRKSCEISSVFSFLSLSMARYRSKRVFSLA